jgi:curved DNA-binding protein CbpA
MKEINDAHDVLSNEEKRRIYDLGETNLRHTHYGSYTHTEDELPEFVKLIVYTLLIIEK